MNIATTQQVLQAITEFNRYFTSANGAAPNARISVPTAEWQALHTMLVSALAQPAEGGEDVGHVRIDSGEVHIIPRVRDAEASPLTDGQKLYTTPPASQEPFGYFRAEPFGWTNCAETDEGAIALYEHPPASQDPCKTCRGVGLIGGFMQDGSGYGEGCPDCNPEPASQEQAQQPSGFAKALEIRAAQGWKLTGNAVPVLYTDEINGQQVMRDDVWLCTTDALKQEQQPKPQPMTDEQIVACKQSSRCADPTERWGDTLAFGRDLLNRRDAQWLAHHGITSDKEPKQ